MDIVQRIQNLIASDDTDQGEQLVAFYQNIGDPETQATVDMLFTYLCGYRLITIIEDPSLGEEL